MEREEEEKEDTEEKSEAQKEPLVDKAQRTNCGPICVGKEGEGDVEEKGRKRNKSPSAKQFLLVLCRCCEWRLEPKGKAEVPEIIIVSGAVWKRSKGADRTEIRKDGEEIEVRIAEWFGLEHRKEVYEKIQRHLRCLQWEQFNREAKEGWRLAASAARITEEMAGDEDRKHTSGGVFLAIDSNLGAVVGCRRRSN